MLVPSTKRVQMRPLWGVNVKVSHTETSSKNVCPHWATTFIAMKNTRPPPPPRHTHILYNTPQQWIRRWLSPVEGSPAIYGLKLQPSEHWLTDRPTDWLTGWTAGFLTGSSVKVYIIAINTKIKDMALDISWLFFLTAIRQTITSADSFCPVWSHLSRNDLSAWALTV